MIPFLTPPPFSKVFEIFEIIKIIFQATTKTNEIVVSLPFVEIGLIEEGTKVETKHKCFSSRRQKKEGANPSIILLIN